MFLCEVVSCLFRVVPPRPHRTGAEALGLLEGRQVFLLLSYGVPRGCSQCEEFKWSIFLDRPVCLSREECHATLSKTKNGTSLGGREGD